MVVAFSYPFGKDDDDPQTLSDGLFTPARITLDTALPPVDFVGRHNGLRTRRYIRYLMGLTDDPDAGRGFTGNNRPPIFRCARKGLITLRTCGIDLAKQRAEDTWLVRPDAHRYVNVTYRVMDIQTVLSLAGFTLIRTDQRTRWTIWQRPA
jgi:hypothetical protein